MLKIVGGEHPFQRRAVSYNELTASAMVVLLRLASHDSKPFVNAKGSNTQHSIVSIVRRHTNFRSHLCESFYYKHNETVAADTAQEVARLRNTAS